MLLGFEGTGWTGREDLRQYAGKEIPYSAGKYFCRSFVATAVMRSNTQPAEYFPGPDVTGSNCDNILVEAKDYFRNYKNRVGEDAARRTKICLFGYSRGAYIAMCFARFLQINEYNVQFLGLFDAVSRDVSVEAAIHTTKIPKNVKCVYHAFRSSKIGSRSVTMNSIGHFWEDGRELEKLNEFSGKIPLEGGFQRELPGSHAAMGGFPNEKGPGDAPHPKQGDPNIPGNFHPQKEVTAWWNAGNFVSSAAVSLGFLRDQLVPQIKPKGYLGNSNDWYQEHSPNHSYKQYYKGAYGTNKI